MHSRQAKSKTNHRQDQQRRTQGLIYPKIYLNIKESLHNHTYPHLPIIMHESTSHCVLQQTLALNDQLFISKFKQQQYFEANSMWFLNFCSPFIYNVAGTSQTIRFIIYVTLILEFLLYIFYIAKYKITGQIVKVKNEIEHVDDEQDLHVVRQAKTIKGIGQNEFRMDQKQFKEWFLHYFGLHSVAIAGCIMYSPYIPQLIFAILHTILFLVACIMQSCDLQKNTTKYVYNTIMAFICFLDILLLFSLTMGVGASGYDNNAKNCYLLL